MPVIFIDNEESAEDKRIAFGSSSNIEKRDVEFLYDTKIIKITPLYKHAKNLDDLENIDGFTKEGIKNKVYGLKLNESGIYSREPVDSWYINNSRYFKYDIDVVIYNNNQEFLQNGKQELDRSKISELLNLGNSKTGKITFAIQVLLNKDEVNFDFINIKHHKKSYVTVIVIFTEYEMKVQVFPEDAYVLLSLIGFTSLISKNFFDPNPTDYFLQRISIHYDEISPSRISLIKAFNINWTEEITKFRGEKETIKGLTYYKMPQKYRIELKPDLYYMIEGYVDASFKYNCWLLTQGTLERFKNPYQRSGVFWLLFHGTNLITWMGKEFKYFTHEPITDKKLLEESYPVYLLRIRSTPEKISEESIEAIWLDYLVNYFDF